MHHMDRQIASRAATMRFMVLLVTLVTGTTLTTASQDSGDVAGEWALTVETDNGTTTPSVTLEQDGSALTGHYSSATLGEADVTGSVTGNEMQFSFEAAVQGFDLEVTYAGVLQDDGTLRGTIDLGGLGSGTFVGTRR